MSKFLNLISRYNGLLSEADQVAPTQDPNVANQDPNVATQQPEVEAQNIETSETNDSAQQLVSNDNIISLINILKNSIASNSSGISNPNQLLNLLDTSDKENLENNITEFVNQYKTNKMVKDSDSTL
jgi:hypothetical protein